MPLLLTQSAQGQDDNTSPSTFNWNTGLVFNQGDLLVLIVTKNDTGGSSVAGWTSKFNQDHGSANTSIFQLIAGAGQSSTIPIGRGTSKIVMTVSVFTGYDEITPFANEVTANVGFSNAPSSPSISLGADNVIVMSGAGKNANGIISVDAQLATILQQSTGSTSGTSGSAGWVAEAGAGNNVGGYAFSFASTNDWTAYTFAIGEGDPVVVDPPILTGPDGTKVNETQITGSVNTNDGSGTLFAWATTNPTELAADIKTNGDQFPVAVAGLQDVALLGVPGQATYIHYVHENATGDSNVVSSSVFLMDAALTVSAVYSGAEIPADSILHYATGDHTAGTQAVYVEAGGNFVIDELVGLTIENRTKGESAVITDNDATTITGVLSGSGLWDNGDDMAVVATIDTGDIAYCETQVVVASEIAPIRWYIYDTSADAYTPVYTQQIDAAGSLDGAYNVALGVTGVPTLTAVPAGNAPTISNAKINQVDDVQAAVSVSTNKPSGTLYYLSSINSSEPRANILAGLTQPVVATGQQDVIVTGLTPDTNYYVHFIHEDVDGESNDIRTGVFKTDVFPAPVLSSPTATATGETTADGTVITDTAGGLLHYLATVSETATLEEIKAGPSQAVIASGQQQVAVTGLTAGTTYWLHYLQVTSESESNTQKTQFTSLFEVAVLTLPTGVAPNLTATISVTTDQGGGDMFYLVSVNATETAATIKATGIEAEVFAAGVQEYSVSGLNPLTAYFSHFVQVTSGDSNVGDSAQFTTGIAPDTSGTTIMGAILITTGGPTINDGLAQWYNRQMDETLNDAESRWLQEQGAAYGPINDMWMELLTPTYAPGTLNDMQLQYWLNGGVF